MTDRQKVTQEQLKLFSSLPIVEQLPLKFTNTGFTLTEISGCCIECKNKILPEYFRGKVNTSFMPKVATINAVGYCEPCHLITPFVHRVYEDYRFMQLTNQGWQEFEFYLKKKESIFQKIKKFFF